MAEQMDRRVTEIPKRECTNISSLVICSLFVVLTAALVGYCSIYSNTRIASMEYDDCGNFCGMNNDDNPFTCGQKDLRKEPKLLHSDESKICVEKCPEGYSDFMDNCFKSDKDEENDVQSNVSTNLEIINYMSIYIFLMCAVAFFFSYICLFLFRHAALYVIWVVNIGAVLFFLLLSVFAVYLGDVPLAAVYLIVGVVLIIMLLWYRKRIKLVARLFKETSKTLIDIPAVMFEPILTFLALIISFVCFIAFAFIVATSGTVERYQDNGKISIRFKPLEIAPFVHILNFISFFWFTQFIFGCQHFVIAGTVCKWYFSRDKNKIVSPVQESFYDLLRFHLGSVCMGSALMTLIKIIRIIVKSIQKQADREGNFIMCCLACCLDFILGYLEQLLQYLVRNAYIVVARDGTPLYQSGKRAFHLLSRNLTDVIALNTFGDIVLVIARLLIVLIAGFVGYIAMDESKYSEYLMIPLIVGIIFALLIAHCFVTVFEMSVDTIFLCFCIDLEENDGTTRPYFMSDGLRKVIMDMKADSNEALMLGAKIDPEMGMAGGSNMPMMPIQQVQNYGMYQDAGMYQNPPDYAGQQVYQQQPQWEGYANPPNYSSQDPWQHQQQNYSTPYPPLPFDKQ